MCIINSQPFIIFLNNIKTANMVAALNTLDLGGISALPTLNELQDFAAKYKISNVQEER